MTIEFVTYGQCCCRLQIVHVSWSFQLGRVPFTFRPKVVVNYIFTNKRAPEKLDLVLPRDFDGLHWTLRLLKSASRKKLTTSFDNSTFCF